MADFQTVILKENRVLAAKFHHLILEFPQPLEFSPGQYLCLKVAAQKVNSYSIAGKIDPTHIELLIDTAPGGPGSRYVEAVKPGEQLSFLGPLGKFVLHPDDGSLRMLFLGTGCGIAPLKCMIESALKEQKITRPIKLYFGLRYSSDIFWEDHFIDLNRQYPHFTFTLCLSKPDTLWQGASGHVTDLLLKDFPQMGDFSAYLCGGSAMMAEATNILTSLGCPPERIYTEKYS